MSAGERREGKRRECRREDSSRWRFHTARRPPSGVVDVSAEGDAGSECQSNGNKDLGSETRTRSNHHRNKEDS